MKKNKLIKSIKAKGLKRGFKKNVSDDAFKNATLYEKPLRLTQKQIKSTNLTMTMEDVEKHVIPMSSKKRQSFLGLHGSFPWGYRGKKYDSLLSTFINNSILSRKIMNELLKIYPKDLFNSDNLQQYWVFDTE